MAKVAILVDGAFYRKRAANLFGHKEPQERAEELFSYCLAHLHRRGEVNDLYKIFYYDCPPYESSAYHPLKRSNLNLKKTPLYTWTVGFYEELKTKRKLALRLGFLSTGTAAFLLKSEVQLGLFSGQKALQDITDSDFIFDITQKGVDMKIGLDIASIAYKKLADRIVLISGDSDFVPAAKLARREGIDFILDPMWAEVKPEFREHVDGLYSPWGNRNL